MVDGEKPGVDARDEGKYVDCLIDRVKVICPTLHKICRLRDVPPSQSLGLVLKK